MADLNITITDAPRSAITVASPGPQGPAGAGLSPIADDRLLGNVSGSTATPSALNATQVKELLDYVSSADLQAAIVAGDGIIINGVPGSGVDPFGSLLVGGTGIDVAYNTTNRQWTVSSEYQITSGTAAPSGGNDGDIYLQYSL